MMFFIRVSALFVSIAWVANSAPNSPSSNTSSDKSANPFIQDMGAVAVPREQQFDLTSRINGRVYRLMISAPPSAEPGRVYPVIYVLDGNWYFRSASDAATWGSGSKEPAIVVGVGYPTQDGQEVSRSRAFDMSISSTSGMEGRGRPAGRYGGGGDSFLRVLEEEMKPFVATRYPIDPKRQCIYGKSLGGLIVLRSLFRNPTAFSTYIIASPSIWFNRRQVLEDEPAFAARVRAGELTLKILFTSAGDEQPTSTDPRSIEFLQEFGGTIDNVVELVGRLKPLNPAKVRVEHVTFPGESHSSVSLASISRGIDFELEPRPR